MNKAITTISALSHDGRGISRENGKTIFISNSLPSETVEYQIVKKHSKFIEAKLVNIVTQSQDRIDAPCQHFGICGGCNLQHMSMSSQIALKQDTLLNQLLHIGKVIPKNILAPLDVHVESLS